MKCSNCNSEVKKGDKKCAKCGATLVRNKSEKSPKTVITERPISIVLIALVSGLFLIVLLVSILPFERETFLHSISLVFVSISPILLIIFIVLIFRNKRRNTKRMVGFTIATLVTFSIFISAISLSVVSIDHFSKANSYFENKQYDVAISNYEIVIEENKDPEQVAYSVQKVAEAENFLKEANELMIKGDDYFSNNQFGDALVEYEKAKETNPYLSGLDKKISDANKEKNKQEVAEAERKEKINFTLEEGNNLYQEKEYSKSLNKFNEVLNLDSNNKEAEKKIGMIEDIIIEVEEMVNEGDESFKEKEYQKALFIYEQVEDLYPNYQQIELKISQCKSALEEEKEPEVIENIVEEEQKKVEITEESEDKFSFDEYINTSKVREYKMVEEEDISIKALGDKLPSEYTAEELDRLPLNHRMKCSITIPRDITEEELKSTFAQIIEDKSIEDSSIDEIIVFAWYFEESVGKTVAMGRAEWCPNGKWEELPPEIAESDIRDSYKIVFYIEIQEYEDGSKYGLTESERMQAFYDLVALQDSVPYDDPEWDEKMDESYVIIADKYGITRSQMFEIGVEGSSKGWPMPPLE